MASSLKMHHTLAVCMLHDQHQKRCSTARSSPAFKHCSRSQDAVASRQAQARLLALSAERDPYCHAKGRSR